MQRPGGMGANSRAVVNTKFLLNTVHGIGSHNRREEVEDCWRQRRLEQDDKRNKQGTRSANATGQRRREVQYQKAPVEEAATSVDDTRTFWAEQKQRAMTATRAASPMEGALVSTMRTGTSSMERGENKTKLGNVGCRDSDSSNVSNVGAKILAVDKQKKRKKKDQKKDKKDKTDKKDKKKSKARKKERRKREGRDARDVDSSNVEESQREQKLESDLSDLIDLSDVVGAKRKKHKKRTSKDQNKHASAKRRREN